MAIRAGKSAASQKKEEAPIISPMEAKKKSDNRFVLLILIFALLCAGGSVATVYFVTNVQFASFFEKTPKPKDFLGPTYDLGEFVSNLSAEGRRYIKVSVIIAFAFEKNYNDMIETEKSKALGEVKHSIDPLKPVLRDLINSILSKTSPPQVTGNNGHEFLKRVLLDAINDKLKNLAPAYEVKEVFLPEMLVQ